ncbi:hypothetical protein GCM10023186_19490 [Hymenobacter koreensis]|uniref:VCBS repeat-containing protein n=2 Tax=Hymenobacter koreensis TaxID=1084523 RepID=A0ABP8IYN0_9BACT
MPLNAHAQLATEPSRIAAIQTNADVLGLIRPLGWEYAEAISGDSAVRAYESYQGTRFAVRGAQTWFKADFDGNGHLDLLVLARRKGIPLVFCVLDSGQNRLRVVRNFYDSGRRRLPNARVVHRQGQALLQYTDFARRLGGNGKPRQRRTQLLAFRQGGFIPYERRPTQYRIDTVRYHSFFGYKTATTLDLLIDPDGQASLRIESTSYDAPHVTTRQNLVTNLDAATQAELTALLNYVRFRQRRSRYKKFGLNHRPIVELTVAYDGGRLKTIYDPNGDGTAGLRWLYRYLEQLRYTKSWQPGTNR